MQDTTDVVEINTNVTKGCKICRETVGGPDKLEESINHFIKVHGYKLLHVGAETIHGSNGQPWHTTTAVLGSE
jgi:hypothetical protein